MDAYILLLIIGLVGLTIYRIVRQVTNGGSSSESSNTRFGIPSPISAAKDEFERGKSDAKSENEQ